MISTFRIFSPPRLRTPLCGVSLKPKLALGYRNCRAASAGISVGAVGRGVFIPSVLVVARPKRNYRGVGATMSPIPSDSRPIVIAGPSGVGKGTLYKLLFERHPGCFSLSVSHTTRSPRPGEKHGVDYHYVTKEEFRDLIGKDGFVEHAQFGDNLYGTSKMAIGDETAKGKVVVLDIEMEGVKQVQKSDMRARYVFIAPPSTEVLEKRLRGRGTETEASIQKRLTQATKEIEFSRSGVFDHIVTNDNLQRAYKDLEEWVYSPSNE